MNKTTVLELFRLNIEKYQSAFPEMTGDIVALLTIHKLISDDKLVEAMRKVARLDTFVRDYVPIEVDRFVDLELS